MNNLTCCIATILNFNTRHLVRGLEPGSWGIGDRGSGLRSAGDQENIKIEAKRGKENRSVKLQTLAWKAKLSHLVLTLYFLVRFGGISGDSSGRPSGSQSVERRSRQTRETRAFSHARVHSRAFCSTARSLFFIVPVKYVFRGSYRGILVIRD